MIFRENKIYSDFSSNIIQQLHPQLSRIFDDHQKRQVKYVPHRIYLTKIFIDVPGAAPQKPGGLVDGDQTRT